MVAFSRLYIHIRFSHNVVILVNVINRKFAFNRKYNTFYFLEISILLSFPDFFQIFYFSISFSILFCISIAFFILVFLLCEYIC